MSWSERHLTVIREELDLPTMSKPMPTTVLTTWQRIRKNRLEYAEDYLLRRLEREPSTVVMGE